MRQPSVLALLVLMTLAVGSAVGAGGPTPVAHSGESTLTGALRGSAVVVSLVVRTVDIGTPGAPRSEVVDSRCTYSSFPCRVVDSLRITVAGRPIVVPLSVYAGLADISTVELRPVRGGARLKLVGGDASESYVVAIDFDERSVKRRTEWSGMDLRHASAVTTYRLVVVGD